MTSTTERLGSTRPPDAPLRVAICTDTYPPQVNGVARTLARLAEALRAQGHEARIFTTSDARAADEGDVRRYAGTPFWGYPELQIALPGTAVVRRDLQEWGPTLVHIATPFGVGLAARAAARSLGLPLVSSYHTSLSTYAHFYGLGMLAEPGWTYLRWFHNGGARTYVPTAAIQRELRARAFANTTIWSRGVDTSLFNPAWRDTGLRASLGALEDTVVVAYVGRLAREKGLDLALGAMHILRRRYDDRRVRFAVVGDGPYEAQCRAGAPEGTIFLGRLTGHALSAFYASADVQLFPSTTDTFGNVLLEGLASGLTIVAAAAATTQEILLPDRGVVVERPGVEAFARAVAAVVDAPARREALARAGRAHAQRQGWPALFERLFDDYRQVINAHSHSGHDGTPARRDGRQPEYVDQPSDRALAPAAAGSVKENVLPTPRLLDTQISPCCASTSPFAMASPSPTPRLSPRRACQKS